MTQEKDPGSSRGLRIRFRQAGGITGGELRLSVDTTDLSSAEARELERLVDECGFFNLRGRGIGGFIPLMQPPWAMDILRYEISIARGSSRNRLAFDDLSLPPELWPLVDRLAGLARGQRHREGEEHTELR